MPDDKPSATVTGHWFGYGGNFCTKEESERLATEAKLQQESNDKWLAENPGSYDGYDW
jgi:hypothetical protein